MSQVPAVEARVAELREIAGRLLASQVAKAQARVVANIAITRQSLIEDTVAAYKLAESEANPQAMISAVRLLAELGQVSLRCPEDRQQAAQHVHLHGNAFVDLPPAETREQWVARKERELGERSAKNNVLKFPDT